MHVVFSYLFEAKSIQAYLFLSGKLKDVISASERLDRMIDTSTDSLIIQVLESLNLTHDLLDLNQSRHCDVSFLRCKGGAFYAVSPNRDHLVALRQLWTLTIQQMFPGLVFTDALAAGETISSAVERGHQLLAQDRNAPQVAMPYATAYCSRDRRTGKAAVPLSNYAKNATLATEMRDAHGPIGLDLDTALHRQAYTLFDLRETSSLQDRFTPETLRPQRYPINLDEEFEFGADQQKNQDYIKDIALIHIDGNGLGLLLRQLKNAMQGKSDEAYHRAFRCFSEAVSAATEVAAQEATAWFASNFELNDQTLLPMRPLVLGGDDVTLFCHAKFALRYAEYFCRAFEHEALERLEELTKSHDLNVKLTASGGIVFHKVGHPFIQSHHFVEALCAKAKQLTKSMVAEGETGPAALACYRVSQVVHADLDDAIASSHQFVLANNQQITIAQVAYLVEPKGDQPSWQQLRQVIQQCSKAKGTEEKAFTLSRWRQMATVLGNGDLDEAKRIFNRGLEMAVENAKAKQEIGVVSALEQLGMKEHRWFKQQGAGLFSPIVDLLNLAHFEEEIGGGDAN